MSRQRKTSAVRAEVPEDAPSNSTRGTERVVPQEANGSKSPAELRLSLIGGGYSPIPAKGKDTLVKGWQKKANASAEVITRWSERYPDHLNTGLLAAHTPGLDVDIEDQAAADAIEDMVREHYADRGKILTRIGRAPKRLIPFRTNAPFKKITRVFGGGGEKIEFLGDGQMFVAFGIHPDTGRPYEWHGGEPGQVKREDLPDVTEAEAEALIDEITQMLCGDFGYADLNGRRITDGGAPRLNNMPPADPEEVRAALSVVPADDYDVWLHVGSALHREFGDDGFETWDEWSKKSAKYDAAGCSKKWEECKKLTEHTVGTIFYHADQASPGWRAAMRGLSLDDFRSYMQAAGYIFMPSGDMWPASKVNARLGKIPLFDADGQPILDENGKPKKIPANTWLDQKRPVEQITWAPSMPAIIPDRLVVEGGWIVRPKMTCFNLYKPPTIVRGDPSKAGPWIDHVRKVYPGDADHIIAFLAHRVQKPGEKINHAILLGGPQGIGKDTILEPVKRAVGPWNFAEVSPKQVMGRFNAFLRSTILRISEVRDLGEFDRFGFYQHMKTYTAAPPDVLRVDEKNLREYSIFNCCGVVYTTNKKDSFYLEEDDRRTFVAWSDLKKEDFTEEYWNTLWRWYDDGGDGHVAAYLATLDISSFNPKAPPLKTAVFWEIVTINSAPEDAELADVLDRLGNPPATTIAKIADAARGAGFFSTDFYDWLTNRKHNRVIPHRMEQCGYVSVRNPSRNDGRWLIGETRHTIYCRVELSVRDRHLAAAAFVRSERGQP